VEHVGTCSERHVLACAGIRRGQVFFALAEKWGMATVKIEDAPELAKEWPRFPR